MLFLCCMLLYPRDTCIQLDQSRQLTTCSCLQPLKSISMAEDRKESKQHADPIITGSPLKQPLASHAPQSTAFPETSKLPGYVAWLQLQYQQQLVTAIANMSGGAMSRLPYPQANAQHSPQFPSSTAAPSGLENAYLQANSNSPFANQLWMDNRAPQAVPPMSPEVGSVQNMLYSTEMPAMAACDTSTPDMDYLRVMAQQSMVNAAGGGQGRQTTLDHAVGQAQFGGEQQFSMSVYVCVVLYMVMPSCSHCCALSLCHCTANIHSSATAKAVLFSVTQLTLFRSFCLARARYLPGHLSRHRLRCAALIRHLSPMGCTISLSVLDCRSILALLWGSNDSSNDQLPCFAAVIYQSK